MNSVWQVSYGCREGMGQTKLFSTQEAAQAFYSTVNQAITLLIADKHYFVEEPTEKEIS